MRNLGDCYGYIRLLLCALLCVLVSACGRATAPPTAALPNAAAELGPLPPPPPVLTELASVTRPCDIAADREGAIVPPAQPPPAELQVYYDGGGNTIVLRGGSAPSLAALSQALGRPELLRELAPGQWLLAAPLRVEQGAALRIAAPEARWLKLRSDETGFASIKVLGGRLELEGVCVSSWHPARERFDENYEDGRSFLLARDGAYMAIRGADLRYLGHDSGESYGVSWRLGAGGEILDSLVAYNYFGLYSYEASDLVMRGNEVHHSVLYGFDPHTRSSRLVIENNVSHDNGKHGIILAEECSDSLIRNNVVYNNLHHGIVIYLRSNNNLVEGNIAYGNAGQGININELTGNIIRGNSVYDNLEAGIGVGQQANRNQVIGNDVRANRKDGIVLYSDAAATVLRDNTVSDNARSGIYVKSEGDAEIAGNEVAGNTVGVYLNVARPPAISREANRIHDNHQADVLTNKPFEKGEFEGATTQETSFHHYFEKRGSLRGRPSRNLFPALF